MTAPKPPSLSRPFRGEYVTDEMLDYWFAGTNFGVQPTADNYRRLLANGLLKHQAGWHNGSTMQSMLKCHSLVTSQGNINRRGKLFIWKYFTNDNV